jgi:hypothetical protein
MLTRKEAHQLIVLKGRQQGVSALDFIFHCYLRSRNMLELEYGEIQFRDDVIKKVESLMEIKDAN